MSLVPGVVVSGDVPEENVLAINWPGIVDYIAAKNSALVSSFRGVSRRDVEHCEAQFAVTFPASYMDFLLTMGEESGDLSPLGRTQSHRFSDLVADFPPSGYPSHRLFKVSYETDTQALVSIDKFLDLANADAHDAQLVEFEPGDAAAPVDPGDFTFGESVVREVFGGLELYLRKYAATALLDSHDQNHGLAVKGTSVEALTRLDFRLAMPDLARVTCLNRDSISVMVSVYNSIKAVDLRIGSVDLRALEAFLDELAANLPGSRLIQVPFEQHD
jgi:hypothetical protein